MKKSIEKIINESQYDFEETVALHVQNSLESFRDAVEAIYDIDIDPDDYEEIDDMFYKALKKL